MREFEGKTAFVTGAASGIGLALARGHGEGGRILNTSSVGGHVGFAGVLAYSTTKHAVVGYSDDMGFGAAVESGMSPDVVATFAIQGVKEGALYIFTHPGTRGEVQERWPRISTAFDAGEASELINSDPDAQRFANKNDVENLYR